VRTFDILGFAVQSLTGHRLRSALIVLAMGIGVTGVVVLTWLGDAARTYVMGEFQSLGTNLLVILPGKAETVGGAPPLFGETPRDLTIDDALALERSPNVQAVAPVIVGNAPVARGRFDREVTVIGSTPELFEVRHLKIGRGKIWDRGQPHRARAVCVLGARLVKDLFGNEPVLGQWVRIGDRRFRVIGTLLSEGRSLGMDLHDMVVIPVASAQALFDRVGLFRILVQAPSREAVTRAESELPGIIAARHEGEEDVTVITEESVLGTFDRILEALTLSVAGIASISLLVAGILVMNVMVVAVSQRREEIGLLKALGAPPGQIRSLFLAEAVLLSVTGALCGVAVGEVATRLVSRLYPVLAPGTPLWAVAAAMGMALGTGILFGVLPARRAARLDPVLALSRR
jgi:putative ABC transport system permease protein